ncbi:MAG: hypothetical protein M1836_005665 [Candelina mexicana]|nr:MAG: hypothetical protein M1836_005665 [Candelina mexicana]
MFSNFDDHDRTEVFVGLKTPPPTCDLIYGQPESRDCFALSQQIISLLVEGRTRLHPADDEWATTRREFKEKGTTRVLLPLSPTVDVPRSYAYGQSKLLSFSIHLADQTFKRHTRFRDTIPKLISGLLGTCLGLLDMVGGSGSQPSSEFATWRDVWSAEFDVNEVCIDIPAQYGGGWTGGKQVFGRFNNLALYLYSPDSVFGEQQRETSSDCSNLPGTVASDLACQRRGGTRRPRPDFGSDDDATSPQQPAQRPRVCSAGADNRYCDHACCNTLKGYRWVSLVLSKALGGMLFGINQLFKEDGIGFCEAVAGSS